MLMDELEKTMQEVMERQKSHLSQNVTQVCHHGIVIYSFCVRLLLFNAICTCILLSNKLVTFYEIVTQLVMLLPK